MIKQYSLTGITFPAFFYGNNYATAGYAKRLILVGISCALCVLVINAQAKDRNKAVSTTGDTGKTTLETCPTITRTSSATIGICSGQRVPILSVSTTATDPPYAIGFARFDVPQVNPYTPTDNSGKAFVGEVPILSGKAIFTDVTFPTNTGTTPKTYYVYACLKPVPADPTCTPFASYTVVVYPAKSGPDFSLKLVEATCNGGASRTDGYLYIDNVNVTDRYDVSIGTVYNGATSYGLAKELPIANIIVEDMARTGQPQSYTVRVFSAGGCYQDKTLTFTSLSCGCPPPKCIPIVTKKLRVP